MKTQEDALSFVLWDAGASVSHRNKGGIARLPDADLHAGAFGAVLDGIVDQIGHELRQLELVAHDERALAAIDREIDAPRLCQRAERPKYAVHNHHEIGRFSF